MQLISSLTGAKTNFPGHDVLVSCFFLHSRAMISFDIRLDGFMSSQKIKEGRKTVKAGAPSAFAWDGPVGTPTETVKEGTGQDTQQMGES